MDIWKNKIKQISGINFNSFEFETLSLIGKIVIIYNKYIMLY